MAIEVAYQSEQYIISTIEVAYQSIEVAYQSIEVAYQSEQYIISAWCAHIGFSSRHTLYFLQPERIQTASVDQMTVAQCSVLSTKK